MKKSLAVLLSLMLMMGAFASAEKASMANPWADYEGIEAMNAAAGTHLCLPPVMGVTDVTCALLENGEFKLAELRFQVNGMQYVFRGAAVYEDISGFYMDDGTTAFAGHEHDQEAFAANQDAMLFRWLDRDVQYVLMVFDGDTMDAEEFMPIVEEMMTIVNSAGANRLPEGVYYDSVSMRAYCSVAAVGSGVYEIEVHWSDSALEDNMWTMTATLSDDDILSYSDCCHARIVTREDGTQSILAADVVPTGFFELVNGSLYWTGAAEVNCRSCIFELPAE